MKTRQIPEREWPEFLNSFSSRHQGWLMNVEVHGQDLGAQVEGTGLLLEGVTHEWDEMKGNTVMIMAGDNPNDHLTHFISRPTEISLEETEGGEDVALSIQADNGTRTLLIFRAAGALP